MAIKDIDIQALGQAINSTWGKASTSNTLGYSVKCNLSAGPRLHLTYGAMLNFGTERQFITLKQKYTKESETIIAAYLKKLKSDYKKMTGQTLKLHEVGNSKNNVEIVSMNVVNSRRTGYFRHKVIYEIETGSVLSTAVEPPERTWKEI